MATWSERRKRNILVLIIAVLIVLIGLPIFFFVYKSPTCSDGKQNGDESGIDCGGSCEKLCQPDNLPIILKGDPQVIKVASTTYAVVIEAENPNVTADILRAGYVFKIYQASSSVPLRILEGKIYIPQGETFAVFQGPIDFGENIPTRATFDWKDETLIWNKAINKVPELEIRNKELVNLETEPKLLADIRNKTLVPVRNIELIAILSDENGNTVGVSRTFVDIVEKGEEVPIVFTWPAPFKSSPTTIEVLIKVLPDKSLL